MNHEIISNVGNLKSYKNYTLPAARSMYGEQITLDSLTKHQRNIRDILEILAIHGEMSTWDMAKTSKLRDMQYIRSREKEYRRLLIGRIDRGKKSSGTIDLGLVIKYLPQNNMGAVYRLSIHGLLYTISALDLTPSDYASMARSYSGVLPLIFGKWDLLKAEIKHPETFLKSIAHGHFFDNVYVLQKQILPISELYQYLQIKYGRYFEKIEESDLAEELSFMFYTDMLVSRDGTDNSIMQLKKIFSRDMEIRNWYEKFLNDFILFYQTKFAALRDSFLSSNGIVEHSPHLN